MESSVSSGTVPLFTNSSEAVLSLSSMMRNDAQEQRAFEADDALLRESLERVVE